MRISTSADMIITCEDSDHDLSQLVKIGETGFKGLQRTSEYCKICGMEWDVGEIYWTPDHETIFQTYQYFT